MSGLQVLKRSAAVSLFALAIGFVLVLFASDEPVSAYRTFLTAPFPRFSGFSVTNISRMGNWIEDATTLTLLGLSVAVAFSAKQYSLGAEGQLFVGALVGGTIALTLQGPPAIVLIPIIMLGATAAGAAFGAVAGALKAQLGVSEIVSTLMLNIIAIKLYQVALTQWLADPDAGFLSSDRFSDAATFPVIIPGTKVTVLTIAVLAIVASSWFLIARSTFGFQLGILGDNERFAVVAGLNTKRLMVSTMALSGAYAGLAGTNLTHALLGQLTLNLSPGIGFEGIVVAMLGRFKPIGVFFGAIFYSYLRVGAQIMSRESDVSREVAIVVQAIIILLITVEVWRQPRWLRIPILGRRRRAEEAD